MPGTSPWKNKIFYQLSVLCIDTCHQTWFISVTPHHCRQLNELPLCL